jgi:WD40 repeat protein
MLAGLAAAVLFLLMTVAAVATIGYVREAAQREAAQAAEKEMRRHWYAASINLAQQAWDTANIPRLRALLAETEQYPDRGFEWYYWQRMCHLDLHTLVGHRAAVMAVSYSPNGHWLATGSADGTAKVWELTSGREILSLNGHIGGVCCLAWSPDGQRLATGSGNGTAKVGDVASGRQLCFIQGCAAYLFNSAAEQKKLSGISLSWSPDGQRLAMGNGDGTIKIWELSSGRELISPGHTSAVERDTRIMSLLGSPLQSNALLAAALLLPRKSSPISSVAWSPDGQRLATASHDGTTIVWEASSGRELLSLSEDADDISVVAWSPDGHQIVAGCRDGMVRLWESASGRAVHSLSGHTIDVHSVAWSPDGRRLATGSQDGTARIWEPSSNRELFTLRGHGGPIHSLSWSPDGKVLATGSEDATAKLWQTASGREALSLKRHADRIEFVSWSPDGQRLATVSDDQTAKISGVSGGREFELNPVAGHRDFVHCSSPVHCAGWSPDSQRVVIAAEDGTVKVWEVASSRELFTLSGHTGTVWFACWSPDGQRLATAGRDGTAKIWDASSGQELVTCKGHQNAVYSVSWSPDGQRLVTASADEMVKIWNAPGGSELLTLKGHSGSVLRVSWSPDGQRLATAGVDRTAKIWEAATGRELLTLKGHSSRVWSLYWSPDGQRLATASLDGTAKVWEVASGRELLTLQGSGNLISSVCWSPDGQRVAIARGDGIVNIWEAATAEAVQQWARQDRAVELLQDRLAFRGPAAKGFFRDWLLLLPLPVALGESGAQALDREQLTGEAMLRPQDGERISIAGQELQWRKYHSPEALLDFNAVLGGVTNRSVAYAICYLESERARDGLWLQAVSDDEGKVYLNGQPVYQYREPRWIESLDSAGPIKLRQGTNVLVFKVVNEQGGWQGCVRLVDDEDLPAQGIRVKLTP